MKLMNKQNLHSLVVICCMIFATILVGCGGESNSSSGMINTSHGYKMAMLNDVEGTTPTDGDVVLFSMKVFANDSMLTSTFAEEYPQEFRWLPEVERQKMNNPVIDAFELMSQGDSVKVLYPADSMKGQKFGLKSGENLVYILKIQKVLNGENYASYAQDRQEKLQAQRAKMQVRAEEVGGQVNEYLTQYKQNKFGDKLIKHPSGLEYVIHEEGKGPKMKVGQKATVHYYGVLKSDGSMFDNSFKRGEPFSFGLGQRQVIPGWDTGVALLNKGSKATLFIPYQMAYGAAGKPPTIPEKSDLVFYIEVPE